MPNLVRLFNNFHIAENCTIDHSWQAFGDQLNRPRISFVTFLALQIVKVKKNCCTLAVCLYFILEKQ